MENAQEKLVRYIQDAHAAEVGITKVLEDFIDEIDDQNIRSAFQEHLTVTESQADRLAQRLQSLGAKPSDGKGIVNTLLAKIGDLMHASHDEYDKKTQDLIKAYATEHLEIGMYTSLAAYANAIGDHETARLAEQIMQEEKQAADKVFPMIGPAATSALNAAAGAGVRAAV